MMKKTFLRGVSVLAAVAMMLGIPSGVLVNAEIGNSGTYNFNDASWHTTTTGNDESGLEGFKFLNCGKSENGQTVATTDIGVFPYEEKGSEDSAIEIKSTTTRDGTGIGLDYGEDKKSGYLESEFDLYLRDHSVVRSLVTRADAGGTSITTIANIDKSGKLKVNGDTTSAQEITLDTNTWYTVRIYYAIASAPSDSTESAPGGTTTVDVYRDGVCIGHKNGTSDVPNASSNYKGAVRYICLTHGQETGSTVIDNWSYAYSETNDYLYREFDSEFKDGAYIGGTQWGGNASGDDASKTTYTIENDYYKIQSTYSKYFNAEYTLTASDYFKAANKNSIAVDFTVNFPDFNKIKKFMMRSGNTSSDQYAWGEIATDGTFKFAGRTTGLTFQKNTDYKIWFRYNTAARYGYLTVSQGETLLYNSSTDTSFDVFSAVQNLLVIGNANAVTRVGFAIEGDSNGSEREIKLKDLKIYEVAGDSFPTQLGIGFVNAEGTKLDSLPADGSLQVKLYGNVSKDFDTENTKLLIAQYGEGNKLLKAEIKDILTEGSLSEVELTPETGTKKVSAFVWDMDGLQPVCKAASLASK